MLICANGHPSPLGAVVCGTCGCDDLDDLIEPPAEPDTSPAAPRHTYEIRAGDVVFDAAEDDEVDVGRGPGSPLATFLSQYPNVSTEHGRFRFERGRLVLDVRKSTNGTFQGGRPLPEGENWFDLPVTIRLASNCYVTFDKAREPCQPTDRDLS